ncbi:type IV pilus biogenesis/stability protein PilW [Vibrio kasasachensis]|uniref:type IV pilus biogenesis/stability protein PilW n=1 Tax=Vibrio kasasachensis TaxID=2910248 RepID=UPI003D0D1A34
MKTRILAIYLTLFLPACVTVDVGNKPVIESHSEQKAESRIALGVGYLQQGNMIKAQENLQKAYQYAPNFYRSQIALAHYYEQVDENSKAENLYRTALAQHPNNGNVLNNYGTFLCKQKQYQKADKLFNQAIEKPDYYLISDSYENAAFCALKSKNKAKAIGYFERALDYDPTRYRSSLNLAKLQIEQNKLADARIRLVRLTKHHGARKEAIKLMIELEEKAGNQLLVEQYQRQLNTLI